MSKRTVIINQLKPASEQRLSKYLQATEALGFAPTPLDLRVYAALRARSSGPCLQKDIAASLAVSPSEFAQVLRRVEDDHRLIERVERRGVIHLTVNDFPAKPEPPVVEPRVKRDQVWRGMQTQVYAVLPEFDVYQVDIEAALDTQAPRVVERCVRLYRWLRAQPDSTQFVAAGHATTYVSAYVITRDLDRLQRSGLIHRFRPDGSAIGFILTIPPQEQDEDTETYRLTLKSASEEVIGGLMNKADQPDEVTLLWNIYFRILAAKKGAVHPRTAKGSSQLNSLLKNTPYEVLAPMFAFFLAVPAHFEEELGSKMSYGDLVSIFYNNIDTITKICRTQRSAYSRVKNDPNWYRSALRPLGLEDLI